MGGGERRTARRVSSHGRRRRSPEKPLEEKHRSRGRETHPSRRARAASRSRASARVRGAARVGRPGRSRLSRSSSPRWLRRCCLRRALSLGREGTDPAPPSGHVSAVGARPFPSSGHAPPHTARPVPPPHVSTRSTRAFFVARARSRFSFISPPRSLSFPTRSRAAPTRFRSTSRRRSRSAVSRCAAAAASSRFRSDSFGFDS